MADQGILTASQTTLLNSQKAPREALGLPSTPRGITIPRYSQSIPGLLRGAVKALMLEIAYVETGNDSAYNQNDRYGRYAVHKNTLINYGYLSDDGTNWLGTEGVSSAATFLASIKLQDRIMERFLIEQYTACIRAKAILENDSIATVAGMLAVAYQFQDYTYATEDYNTSYLVSRGANLSVQLANTLSYLGYANVAYNHYVESNIGTIASEFRQKGISSNDPIDQRRLMPIIDDINTTSVKTTQIVQTALFANIEGSAKQTAIINARANISILDDKLRKVYQSLPANRAKEWRVGGNINDSQTRPGALFFNAGKYAISNLNAG